MNSYIKSQIQNMLLITKTFEQACDMAAKQDDGIISPTEEHELRKIKAASQKFQNELKKV